MAPVTFLRPEFLLLLLPAFAAAALLRRLRPGEWARPALPLSRALLALLLVFALAQPVHGEIAVRPALVLAVDQSASLGAAGRAALIDEARALLAREPAARLVPFGQRPAVAAGLDSWPETATLGLDGTDVSAALDLGGELATGPGGRVVLLSDGLATQGDAVAAAARLHAQGVTVDVWPYRAPAPRDAAVIAVDVPHALRAGEPYEVVAHVYATDAASSTLALQEDGTLLAQQSVSLQPGDNPFSVQVAAQDAGRHAFVASVAMPGDAQPANDALSATTWIYPVPRVLLVAPLGDGGPIEPAMRAAGIDVQVTAPASLPTRLSTLGAYDGVVLANVPASALSHDQSLALQQYARDLGHGLLVIGGRQSYTLGGYEGTPLADALPLEMQPPRHPERPPIALLLVIDHSASMGEDQPGTKLTLAKEAAMRAVEALRADDYVGVLQFDDSYDWVVPFQKVGEGTNPVAIMDRIAGIPSGGATSLYQALHFALPDLLKLPVRTRHALVITDGLTQDGTPDLFQQLAMQARAAGGTLSAIAVGADADAKLTAEIASWGGGRYHFAANPQDLPALTLQETRVTQSQSVQEGDFQPVAPAPHPMLRGFRAADLPALTGYVALTPRPEADVALVAGPGDPLLAVWQYGLGRVAAWTADDEREWAASWADWPDAGKFWAQVMRYTLPDPEVSGPASVRAVAEGGGRVRVTVQAAGDDGRPLDLADAAATLTAPDGREWRVPLTQVAPGRYEQVVAVPATGSAYFVEATVRSGSFATTARTGVTVGYPPEFRPGGDGAQALDQVAAAGGGRVLAGAMDVPIAAPAADAAAVPLWPWFLGAAALLFPVYVALRRSMAGAT